MNRVRVASRLRNIMRLMDKAFAMVRSWLKGRLKTLSDGLFFRTALTGITQTLRYAVDGQVNHQQGVRIVGLFA